MLSLDEELQQLRVKYADEARRLHVLQRRPVEVERLTVAATTLQHALANTRRRVADASTALEDTQTRRYQGTLLAC